MDILLRKENITSAIRIVQSIGPRKYFAIHLLIFSSADISVYSSLQYQPCSLL